MGGSGVRSHVLLVEPWRQQVPHGPVVDRAAALEHCTRTGVGRATTLEHCTRASVGRAAAPTSWVAAHSLRLAPALERPLGVKHAADARARRPHAVNNRHHRGGRGNERHLHPELHVSGEDASGGSGAQGEDKNGREVGV